MNHIKIRKPVIQVNAHESEAVIGGSQEVNRALYRRVASEVLVPSSFVNLMIAIKRPTKPESIKTVIEFIP